eukprot:JP436582.1.p3 GENE.JP436582.1~~JP436582.1.p3  ORF type:complete len:53 (-),score=11.08 JP436582.1:297-455(-)
MNEFEKAPRLVTYPENILLIVGLADLNIPSVFMNVFENSCGLSQIENGAISI